MLALLVIAGVVQRCLFSAWRYLALFGFAGVGFAGVAGRSCTLPLEARGSILDGFLMILEGFWCDFGSFLDGFRMIFGKILVEIFWEDFGNVLGIC